MPEATIQFALLPSAFDINSHDSVSSLAAILEPITTELAQSKPLRERLGEKELIWSDLRKLWHDLSRAQLTFWDNDDSDDETVADQEKQKQSTLRLLSASLARFTRNLVAGVPRNQIEAFENEPSIRRLLHYYTSWSFLEDQEALLVARVLSQALANLVSGNDKLASKLWSSYMNLPEDQVVLIRLLASPDPRTLVAALIVILSCIDGSRTRIKMLTRTAIGVRVCICLLDDMVKIYDAEESTDEAQAFDIGYGIFSRIMDADLVPSLFGRLGVKDEVITPHQTTLLKLVDSYLQSASMSTAPATPLGTPLYSKLRPMLAKSFFTLSTYAQNSIRDSLSPSPAQLGSLDVMLPKACEALVLVAQCILTVTLGSSVGIEQSSQDYFNEARAGAVGLVESLTGKSFQLLRLLDIFLPRINFGKPVPDAGRAQPSNVGGDGSTGFNYLKRDLVRLLGILCHENKAVQDRARQCGGIEVVMNLCVVDERNPYLREHAIFTLHNLLDGNAENQAVVDSIQPSGKWDDNGVLVDSAGAVRK
ncbi:Ataxin-10-like protein [Mycena indigotica]|uniref:Ataxin-10 homolog n=1 Tax=Mycena indigotica TaxID=2126181 RepID=A0A8H6WAY4_9AGAR|nr:Ataxin-10-like protein [Mycena indigotica]KAF7309646.1 Ataxin-10-like protein [Mycena indigotica]